MKKFPLMSLTLTLTLTLTGYSQNIAITDDDGYTAHPSAMLDVKSSTKGFLTPRLTTIQRTTISTPATGLLVFDSDLNSYYFYNGAGWVNITYGNPSNIWSLSGSNVFLTNTSHHVGVGTTAPVGKLEVKGDVPLSSNAPLFEVLNSSGDTVFAVYSQGVRVYVADDPTVKAAGSRSGFAVGGFSLTKEITNEYLRVTPDSVRIYIEESPGAKASGSKGGFAVGGFSLTKEINSEFLSVKYDTSEIINPSEPRILFYPNKNAFLTGQVIIESKDSVGKNSFASGFESKSIGDWSQALGYKPIARGDYSTAIGKNAVASSLNSFAFGDGAKALNLDAYSFGAFTEARGIGSFAFGYVGRDSLGPTGTVTKASGNYSFAFGLGSQALAEGAMAFGTNDSAINLFSLSMGYKTKASGWYSTAMGAYTKASGSGSTTIGYMTTASGNHSTAMGYSTRAIGDISTAMGYETAASGLVSTAMGRHTTASEYYSTAMGCETTASGFISTAMGYYTRASGRYSTAMGIYTTAQPHSSFVIGRYNVISGTTDGWVSTDPLFIIGNGSSDGARSNAITVLKNGNVGIGISSPSYLLDVSGTCNLNNGVSSGIALRVNGTEALWFNGTYYSWGSGATSNYFAKPVGIKVVTPAYSLDVKGRSRFVSDGSVSAGCWYTTIAGSNSAFIGMNTDDFIGIWGENAFCWAFNMNVTDGSIYMPNVYNHTTASSANLYINSSGRLMRSTSSARYKKDIDDLKINTENIYKLHPVSYRSKDDNSVHFGLVAEEVADVIPELVEWSPERIINPGSLSEKLVPDGVQYSLLSVLLLEQVKKHSETLNNNTSEIESLKAENQNLKLYCNTLSNEIDKLKAEIESIKKVNQKKEFE